MRRPRTAEVFIVGKFLQAKSKEMKKKSDTFVDVLFYK